MTNDYRAAYHASEFSFGSAPFGLEDDPCTYDDERRMPSFEPGLAVDEGYWGDDEEEACFAADWQGNAKTLGAFGEDLACELLKRKDYIVVERNWTCPAGEADIIAIDEGCLVFVEVKTRAGSDRGFPQEAVTAKKRSKYERIAYYFLSSYDGDDMRVRFDVIAIQVMPNGKGFVKHIVNAFGQGA